VPFTIGYRSASFPNYWDGALFDVRFYSRALAAADVADVYNTKGVIPNLFDSPIFGEGCIR
jgi:hypothetical protein